MGSMSRPIPNILAPAGRHLGQASQRCGALLFLSGYQLWFDGRKDEARALFRSGPGPAFLIP